MRRARRERVHPSANDVHPSANVDPVQDRDEPNDQLRSVDPAVEHEEAPNRANETSGRCKVGRNSFRREHELGDVVRVMTEFLQRREGASHLRVELSRRDEVSLQENPRRRERGIGAP
ncbi:MAG: hypothetical protein KIT84_08360 [Labilithrix sp.]|nr:hypothetical protein [Labilithrix sp.]MCW5811010.1 hypothetical protein [Labilithrix sp.]